MSQAERTDGSAPQDLPNSHYEHFGRVLAPGSDVPVGLVPLEVVFEKGLVTFGKWDFIMDVGAGTGRSMEFVARHIPSEIRRYPILIMAEPDADSRRMIGDRLFPMSLNPPTIIDKDGIEAFRAYPGLLDKVFWINSVHMFPEDERVAAIRASIGSLKPGGQLVMTSAFTTKSETEQRELISPWIREARLRLTSTENAIVELAKEKGVMRRWEAQRYLDELTNAGYEIEFADPAVEMPATGEAYEGIAHYSGWNDNLIPGLDRDRQVELMVGAFTKVWYKDLKREPQTVSPRRTLVLVARKPLAAAA